MLLREAVEEAFSGAPTSAGLSISESICNGFDVPRAAIPSTAYRSRCPKDDRGVQAVHSFVSARPIADCAGPWNGRQDGPDAPVAAFGVGTGVRLG